MKTYKGKFQTWLWGACEINITTLNTNDESDLKAYLAPSDGTGQPKDNHPNYELPLTEVKAH